MSSRMDQEQHYHAVRFYDDDAALCRMVAEFLGDGLAAGQPAVCIAVPAHADMIGNELRAMAFDVEQLRDAGMFSMLDAEKTLSAFMKSGSPDAAAFQDTVGGVLDGVVAGREHSRVRAYGEMVDWLWKSNATTAAIQLEVLWNQLANTRRFSLLCGYSMGHFYKHGAYEDICQQHSHVVSHTAHPTPVIVAE